MYKCIVLVLCVLVPVLSYWLFWPLMCTFFAAAIVAVDVVVVVVVVVGSLSGNFVFIRFLFNFACFFSLTLLFFYLLYCFFFSNTCAYTYRVCSSHSIVH